MRRVVLYTKPGCCLCDRLKADLAWLHEEAPFVLEERNIEEDAEAAERFRYLVPVLAVGEEAEDAIYLYPPHDLLQIRRVLLEAGPTRPNH
ncbi:MAG TPA: glutaredoxin family protein [Caldilineaceae bacterium]|nr:glutaredoxin family protein [Caldilineaceae bacterium]